MMQIEDISYCPECKSNLINDFLKGEYICQNCGYVVLDQINDYGPENHSTDYEEKTKNTRASGNMSLSQHDYGLRTEIGSSGKDFGGKSINHQLIDQYNTIRKWHSRIRVSSSKDRRLSNILSKINETCSQLSLPKILSETAAMIYRNYEKYSEAKGKSVSCMAAASIFLACKKCSIVRSMEEIVIATGISIQDKSNIKLASKYYRNLVIELENNPDINTINNHKYNERDLKNKNYNVTLLDDSNRTSQTSNDYLETLHLEEDQLSKSKIYIDKYISKLANMAKIDTTIERLAIDIAHKTVQFVTIDGKSPNGIAAAYIYLAAVLQGINLLQIDVSGLAGVTEVTIRNRCKDILLSSKMIITINPQIK